MTLRANIQIATLAGLVALGAGAVYAKSGDQADRFGQIDADGNGEITQAELTAHGKARFDAMDANSDGLLDAAEMTAARAERRGDRAARMLERYDADGSGALDAAELEKATSERNGQRADNGNRRDRGQRALQRLDSNEDGKLSFEEVSGGRDPARILDRLDADGNGTLSAAEFAKAGEGRRQRREKQSGE